MRQDHFADDIGTLSVEPADLAVRVGRKYRCTITYTAGPGGVAEGGCVRFRLPGLKLEELRRGAPVCCSDPEVRLECANTVPVTHGKPGYEFFTIDYLFVTVRDKALAPGETISVVYGHGLASKYLFASAAAGPFHMEAAVDIDGTRSAPGSGFYLVRNAPVVTFESDNPVCLEMTIPSIVSAGERFEAFVRARDQYRNIAERYAGTVTLFAGPFENRTVLGTAAFTPEDRGVRRMEAAIDEEGVHRLSVADEASGMYARSNAVRVTAGEPAYRLYWGDTHTHSTVSADSAALNDFIPRPAGDYDYARNRAGLDFCMVTDHSENQCPEDWKETREAARDAYEPGKFVAFSAYESTHAPQREAGDKNVYFFDDDGMYVNEGDTAEVYRRLKESGSKVMVIPHMHCHTLWEYHDPELERVAEVYAHWGNGLVPDSEYPMVSAIKPEQHVCGALERGIRLGFIASADHSWGHPGDDFWWPLNNYQGGLAAVYAPELTREGIWDGLWNRYCYGTTRARILLEFGINGHRMGEEIEDGGSRKLTVGAYGTAEIDFAEIVRNGETVHREPGRKSPDLEFAFTDDGSYRDTDYYYVHVRQTDGEHAWASPIWISWGA
jgi:hypothetical protein